MTAERFASPSVVSHSAKVGLSSAKGDRNPGITNCQITSANGLLPAGGPLIKSQGVAFGAACASSEDESWITF